MLYKYVHGNLELLYLLQVCELPCLLIKWSNWINMSFRFNLEGQHYGSYSLFISLSKESGGSSHIYIIFFRANCHGHMKSMKLVMIIWIPGPNCGELHFRWWRVKTRANGAPRKTMIFLGKTTSYLQFSDQNNRAKCITYLHILFK